MTNAARTALLVFLAACFGSIAQAEAQQDSLPAHDAAALLGVTIEPKRILRNQRFDWPHKIQVALPPSYGKTNKHYPVLGR